MAGTLVLNRPVIGLFSSFVTELDHLLHGRCRERLHEFSMDYPVPEVDAEDDEIVSYLTDTVERVKKQYQMDELTVSIEEIDARKMVRFRIQRS